MSQSLIFRSLTKRNKINRKTVSKRIKESEKVVNYLVMILICAMGLLYIFQTNDITTKGYDVEKYEKKLSNLQKENQKMAVELADLKSMDNFGDKINRFSAISYKDITYITSSSSIVAMK